MLEGVRQDVVHDLVEVALVDPEFLDFARRLQVQVDVPGHGHVVERLHDVADEVVDVGLEEVQLHLPFVHFPHVHQLVHQAEDPERVAVHQVVEPFLVRVLLRFAHLFER